MLSGRTPTYWRWRASARCAITPADQSPTTQNSGFSKRAAWRELRATPRPDASSWCWTRTTASGWPAPCTRPGNARGAALVVAIVASGRGPTAFDVGRAAQNMMLAAWEEGVGSCLARALLCFARGGSDAHFSPVEQSQPVRAGGADTAPRRRLHEPMSPRANRTSPFSNRWRKSAEIPDRLLKIDSDRRQLANTRTNRRSHSPKRSRPSSRRRTIPFDDEERFRLADRDRSYVLTPRVAVMLESVKRTSE
jgi:hypothetical protein